MINNNNIDNTNNANITRSTYCNDLQQYQHHQLYIKLNIPYNNTNSIKNANNNKTNTIINTKN